MDSDQLKNGYFTIQGRVDFIFNSAAKVYIFPPAPFNRKEIGIHFLITHMLVSRGFEITDKRSEAELDLVCKTIDLGEPAEYTTIFLDFYNDDIQVWRGSVDMRINEFPGNESKLLEKLFLQIDLETSKQATT